MSMVRGIVIGGPTGVGKTDLAALLAQRLNGELISCDSVQIYTGLTIGANKTPTPVPQHLIDLKHWSCAFTAADFLQSCWKAVKEVVGRGRVPILVGGTGFYLDWVVRGRPGAPPTDPLVLKEVEEMLAKDANWEESLKRLMEVDEEYAAVLMRNDYYRLKRALVVQKMTGAPLSSFKHRRRSSEELSVDWRCFYLTVSNRMALLAHLDKRCEMMVQRGLVQEVLQLVKQGFGPDCQAGRAIGYKEVLDLLAKLRRLPREQWDAAFVEFIGEFQSQTRQYTRRQEKWFYGMQEFQWIERPSLSEDLPDSLIERVASLFTAVNGEGKVGETNGADGINTEETANTSNTIQMECKEFRERCRTPSKEKTKRLRSFRSVLCIYNDPDVRKTLLDSLDLTDSINSIEKSPNKL